MVDTGGKSIKGLFLWLNLHLLVWIISFLRKNNSKRYHIKETASSHGVLKKALFNHEVVIDWLIDW
jgi:hypothetical protein